MAQNPPVPGWRSWSLQSGTNYKGKLMWVWTWKNGLVCVSFSSHHSELYIPNSSSYQIPAAPQPRQTSWPHALNALPPWKEWHHFALVVVVWSVFQAEAPLQPSLLLLYVCWRLLLMGLLWLGLGGCVYFLKCWFQQQVSAATNWAETAVDSFFPPLHEM